MGHAVCLADDPGQRAGEHHGPGRHPVADGTDPQPVAHRLARRRHHVSAIAFNRARDRLRAFGNAGITTAVSDALSDS